MSEKITMIEKLIDALNELDNLDTSDLDIASKVSLHTAQNTIVEAINMVDNKGYQTKTKTFLEDNPEFADEYNQYFNEE